MGGINHQPTKKFFEFSTMLSQYFSGSIEKLMRANYELEHALLAELYGAPAARVAFLVSRAKLEVSDSAQFVVNAIEAIDLLAKRMVELQYADTSRSTVADYEQLGYELAQQGLIPSDKQIWGTISQVRQTESFFGICRLFRERFQNLIASIRELNAMFDDAQKHAEDGRLIPAIDENQIPFRQSFFQVLTKMVETLTMFIHSAAMSTEMYYREEGYGSLLSEREEAIPA